MMTPLQFERTYQDAWAELESMLDALLRRSRGSARLSGDGGIRLASLYRHACEHLALARARCYPRHIVERLERITADAHQVIYRQRDSGLQRVRTMLAVDFPAAVRHHLAYVLTSAAVFLLPTVVLGILVYRRPELILSVVSADTASSFEQMYSPGAESIGQIRGASTDWMMFGYYIANNVGVAFQCFAAGLFAGTGSLFFLAYNGAFGGAIAGYLTARGLSPVFFSFVATHSAFELTAIVLAGAAGLRIGHALLAPGRQTRLQALVDATRGCAALLYGLTAMLLVAAAIEAFWSSARWLPPSIKYTVAAVCWTGVFAYLTLSGRRRAA